MINLLANFFNQRPLVGLLALITVVLIFWTGIIYAFIEHGFVYALGFFGVFFITMKTLNNKLMKRLRALNPHKDFH